MAAKTGKLTAIGARKEQFLQRDFGDLEVQMVVGDVTSPITAFPVDERNVPCRLKKKPFWRSFCSSATQPLPSPRETVIMCPPFSPWTTTHFTVSPFIPDCTGNSTARLQSASSRLSSLPPSDIQVWTDGSLPSLFGPSSAGVYVTCSKCNTSKSLSFSSGPIASSFKAETFGLKQGLVWCTSHLMICKFQSVLF